MIVVVARRLPFFYGWVIVAVAFTTMAIGVNVRTAFSLLFPPILDEFGWDRAMTAGTFSIGFLVSAVLGPFIGHLMDRRGPRAVIGLGIAGAAAGMLLTPLAQAPWQLYATLGVLVGAGTSCLGYTVHALLLSAWFERRRGLATSIAFAGVGLGSIVVLPWLQAMIGRDGWRSACGTLGLLTAVVLAPLCLLLARRPSHLGLAPDGDPGQPTMPAGAAANVVDAAWAAIDWTLARALRTARFWWLVLGYATAMYVWYAVQIHQTKYLVEIGIDATEAAWALGFVSLVAIPGQIGLGHLSDRIGREWVWTIGSLGFAVCGLTLLAMATAPTPLWLTVMVVAQGALGYGVTSVIGAIPAEIFEGRGYGAIFGTLMMAALGGGAVGPWATGLLHDATGSYATAFWVAIASSAVSALAIWRAAPRRVRLVAGRVRARPPGCPLR